MSARRGFLVVLAGVALVAVGFLAGRRAPSSALPPMEPWRYVPGASAAALSVDVSRLRASPHLRRWLSSAPERSEPCEVTLTRGVRTLVVVVPRWPVEDLALVAQGTLPRDALLRCARARGGARNDVLTERYRGHEVVRVAPRASSPEAVRPPAASEVLFLPGGVVLAGGGELVRRMLDQGLAPPEREPLTALLRRVGSRRAVRAAGWFPNGERGQSPLSRALEHATGAALGLDLDRGLTLEVALPCDTPQHARETAERLEGLRTTLERELEDEGLRELSRRATLRPSGAEVRLSASLDPPQLDALLGRFEALARGLARALAEEPPRAP